MNLELDIQVATSATTLPSTADFERWVAAALHDHRDRAEVSLRLIDEEEMRTLNRDYRGKDYATNVLSFPADLPPELELELLGDIAICAPVVAREAADQHKPAQAHWAHLTVHGTLHLLGYDHIEEDEADAMEALETAILARLGFPDPYQLTPGLSEDSTQSHG
ncbi:MAG: rRNA maturation RNase YbeY [Spongiibacteraceae bacterium]|jgi:probable rRNA maturation factor|nr:rRNA maturation RNase YbeY [Spongiibacteraceae bacterium]